MPIYEYVCNACGCKRDALQGIKDPELKDCLECHQPALKRLVSAAGFRLKGGGWYETDFKKDGDKKKNLVNKEENRAPLVSNDTNASSPVTPVSKESKTTDNKE